MRLNPQERPSHLSEVQALLRPSSSGSAGVNRPGTHGVRIAAHRSWVTQLAMNSQVLVSAGADQQVKVWTLTGEPVRTLDGLRAAPVGLRLLPTGIVAADARGRVHCWAGNTYHAADSGGSVERLCALGADRFVTQGDRQQLHLWTVPEVRALGHDPQAGQRVTALQDAPDGSLVLGTGQGEVLRYDLRQMRRSLLLGGLPGPVTSLVVGARGQTFAASGPTVHLVGGGLLATLPEAVQALVLGGASENLFVAAGGVLYQIGKPGEPPQPLLDSTFRIRCLTASSSHLVLGLEDGHVQLLKFQNEGQSPSLM